jgi:uncharacterized protein
LSSLGDRIRGIVKAPGPPPASSAAPSSAPPPPRPAAPAPSDVGRTLGGDWRGGCLVVERRRPNGTRHGRQTVGAVAEELDRSAAEARLFAAGEPRPPFVFFDLETTGLNGGAGTHVFLVGCGWFADDGAFLTRQFLLTRPGDQRHERPMLDTVRAELARAGTLVSFNGKSFDAPLLETRYLFHRLEWMGGDLPHLDILHPARRFWGLNMARPTRELHALPSAREGCTLGALERKILGAKRIGDVAGFDVPSRYFQFVRTGSSQPLVAVLEHNRQDLLTLAALTVRLLYLSRVGPPAARDAAEALALGRTYARAGHEDRARQALARAIAMSRAPAGAFDPVRIEGLRSLALAWRRVRQFDEAAKCWRELLDARGCPPHVAREATEALAIHHEHRTRNLLTARDFALQGLAALSTPVAQEATQHRLARIERKLSRNPPGLPMLLSGH